jgi:hypothetical protein
MDPGDGLPGYAGRMSRRAASSTETTSWTASGYKAGLSGTALLTSGTRCTATTTGSRMPTFTSARAASLASVPLNLRGAIG